MVIVGTSACHHDWPAFEPRHAPGAVVVDERPFYDDEGGPRSCAVLTLVLGESCSACKGLEVKRGDVPLVLSIDHSSAATPPSSPGWARPNRDAAGKVHSSTKVAVRAGAEPITVKGACLLAGKSVGAGAKVDTSPAGLSIAVSDACASDIVEVSCP